MALSTSAAVASGIVAMISSVAESVPDMVPVPVEAIHWPLT